METCRTKPLDVSLKGIKCESITPENRSWLKRAADKRADAWAESKKKLTDARK